MKNSNNLSHDILEREKKLEILRYEIAQLKQMEYVLQEATKNAEKSDFSIDSTASLERILQARKNYDASRRTTSGYVIRIQRVDKKLVDELNKYIAQHCTFSNTSKAFTGALNGFILKCIRKGIKEIV